MSNYEKFKWLICATYLLTVFLPIHCHYGADCPAEESICQLLKDCPPILNEIKKAGSPMPIQLRRKLKNLMCGFDYDEPLVCCPLQINYNNQVIENNSGSETTKLDFNKDNTTVNKIDNDVTKYEGPADVSNHPKINLLPTKCGVSDSDRIIGGKNTGLYAMPWMALIAYNTSNGIELNCGGTIINEWYVLTAAHCVSFLGNRLKLDHVILGEYDITTDPDCEIIDENENCAPRSLNISIAEVISHPGFSPQNSNDDIALIRLSKRVKLVGADGLRPICLPITPELQSEELIGQIGEAVGWGATDTGPHSSKLQSVGIPILKKQDCENAYGIKINERQMCGGGVKGEDSCGGDSGGPLMSYGKLSSNLRLVQRGIVSIGPKRCGRGGSPGMYTNVAWYIDWILDNIRE